MKAPDYRSDDIYSTIARTIVNTGRSLTFAAILVTGVVALLAVELFARIDSEQEGEGKGQGLAVDAESAWDTCGLSPAERLPSSRVISLIAPY